MSTGSFTVAALTGSATQPDVRAIASAIFFVFPVVDWYTTLTRMIPPLIMFTSGSMGRAPQRLGGKCPQSGLNTILPPSSAITNNLGISSPDTRVRRGWDALRWNGTTVPCLAHAIGLPSSDARKAEELLPDYRVIMGRHLNAFDASTSPRRTWRYDEKSSGYHGIDCDCGLADCMQGT